MSQPLFFVILLNTDRKQSYRDVASIQYSMNGTTFYSDFERHEWKDVWSWRNERRIQMSFFIVSCIVGIVVSAFMVIKTGREESQIENEYIEQEGKKYIERMHEEKARRMQNTSEEVV